MHDRELSQASVDDVALQDRDASDATLILRLTLAVLSLASGIATWVGPPERWKAAQGWLPPERLLLPSALYATALVAVGTALLIGWRTQRTAITAAGVALAVHLEWLRLDPLYAPLRHVAPVLLLALALATTAASGDRFGIDALLRRNRRVNVRAISLLAARIFVGTTFAAQGWTSAFRGGGLVGFARKVYVEPHRATFLPDALLWFAGVTNPLIQLATGVALVVGLRTRLAASIAGLFLGTIVFGHAVTDPFDTPADLHQYALQNLAAVITILLLARTGDPLGIDGVLREAPRVRREEVPGSP